MTQPEKIEHILNKGCDYFGIRRSDLQENKGNRSRYWEKKQFLIKILSDTTVCSHDEIANYLGYKQHSNVIYQLRRINEDLSGELYGSQKKRMIYNELVSYINLKN